MKKTDLFLKPGTYIKASTTQGEVQGISLENFVVSVLNNPTCCPKPPGSPDGMLMTALALNPTLQTVTDFLGNSSAIQLSTLRLGITSDSSVTTQTSSVIQATTTDANLVIAPNGTGALVAQIPDGTVTGGNARGGGAVDLQRTRNAVTQVASGGASVISGGIRNSATNTYSTVSGGFGNTASGSTATVVGGNGNTASGEWSVTGGRSNSATAQDTVVFGNGNNATSSYSTVSGGQSNTASTNTHATVVGGSSNVSSGLTSISGGSSNTASGSWSVSFGRSNSAQSTVSFCLGQDNISSNQYAMSIGGQSTASGFASLAIGFRGTAYLYGQNTVAAGYFSGLSDAQQSSLTARREASLNSAATTVLSLDGTGTTNLISPSGNNRLWAVKVVATAFVSVAGGTLVLGDSYMGEFTLLFKRVGGTSSVVGVNSANLIYDTNMATAAFTFAAGASQDLQITFKAPTTASATTFRCVAKVELVEVAY